MLQTLKIKNVALISELEINFSQGLNLLLGETGAGKSIIFDALNFVLGAKAEKSLIRSGEDFMRVDAVFSNLSKAASHALLLDGAIEDDCTEVALTRIFDSNGKNTARINGLPVTTQMLKNCGDVLVDSYSQHESLELLKSKNHLLMLDKLGGDVLKAKKDEVADLYQSYQNILHEMERLGGGDRERTMSILDYQIREIEDAKLEVDEDEEIKAKLNYMQNAEKIALASRNCEELLTGSSMSAVNNVCSVINELSQLTAVNEISDCVERLNSVKYELQDISETMVSLGEGDFDEEELEQLDKRYDLIKTLCRKYGGSIESALEFLEKSKQEYDNLNSAEEKLSELELKKSDVQKELLQACENLSDERKKVAKVVEQNLMQQLSDLGMKSTRFVVNFDRQSISATGFDLVEFAFSANVGQEVKSLSKTASGGEISRVMLAFKTIFANVGLAQTLIFDEIDTGISGEIGYVVGEKLKKLSAGQVICVTHLAQVASYGNEFFLVSKSNDGVQTYTVAKALEGDEVDYQLARMIGGDNVTDIGLANVREMRRRAMAN